MKINQHTHPPLNERIKTLLQSDGYKPMTADELANALALPRHSRPSFIKLLHQLVIDGEIVLIRKNRYALGEAADLVTGRLEVRYSGDGHLVADKENTLIRIRRDDMGTAMPGDTVSVRLDSSQQRKGSLLLREGKVIRILERGRRLIVGTLKTTGKFHYVVPMSPSYQKDIYVPDAHGGTIDDRVVVQFVQWVNRHVNPEGEIIEVIGPADNPSLDTLSVIRHYSLRDTFPPEVSREAEGSLDRLQNPGQRLDYRDHFVFTVDPVTARDFDDALSLETDTEGNRILGVHIADVTHYVAPGTELDKEAYIRGNSVYLPDKVLPMLPEQLSNMLCSLNPNQDRLAFSAFLTFDASGHIIKRTFARTIIRSRLRLNYEQALQIIEMRPGLRCPVQGVSPEAVKLIHTINEMAQNLRHQRFAIHHALDMELPECDIIIGADGLIADIKRTQSDLAHQMIEECMVAANEAVDQELSQKGIALIHRFHDDPSPDRIKELTQELRDMGFRVGDLKHRKNLADFLTMARQTPLADQAQISVLRSMKRAIYSAEKKGHYGLAKRYYAHFTSPIRRYPDLVVHRILAAVLTGAKQSNTLDDLKQIAQHCSATEDIAAQAERDIYEIKKYRFFTQQIEQNTVQDYDAVVVKVTNFGMFVELPQLEVQGLVHIATISDQFVRYDIANRSLRAGRDVYTVGSKIRVRIAKVDFEQRRLDFAMVGQKEKKREPAPGRRSHDRRSSSNRRR